jgi:hypothetical protein
MQSLGNVKPLSVQPADVNNNLTYGKHGHQSEKNEKETVRYSS